MVGFPAKVTVSRFPQNWNAEFPISLILSGMVIDVNSPQPVKELSSILVQLVGMATDPLLSGTTAQSHVPSEATRVSR